MMLYPFVFSVPSIAVLFLTPLHPPPPISFKHTITQPSHIELTQEVRDTLAQDKFEQRKSKHRLLLLCAILHAADVSNPVLPQEISRGWSDRVVIEFNRQVAREQAMDLPVSVYMDVELGSSSQAKVLGFRYYFWFSCISCSLSLFLFPSLSLFPSLYLSLS